MAEKTEEEKNKKIILPPYQYPYCEFKFMEWNPVQEKCYPFFTQDNNLVVSSSTASGKTVIAEAIMGYELQKNINNKVIYVSPLKAIGIEKFQNWNKHPTFKEISKILVSSDQNVNQSDFQNSRMIISTVESMNIRCRARDKWIENVKLLAQGKRCEKHASHHSWGIQLRQEQLPCHVYGAWLYECLIVFFQDVPFFYIIKLILFQFFESIPTWICNR